MNGLEYWRDCALELIETDLHVSPSQILQRGRRKTVVRARALACWLLREVCEYSFPEIGNLLNLDHSSVLHHCRRVGAWSDDISIARRERLRAALATMYAQGFPQG